MSCTKEEPLHKRCVANCLPSSSLEDQDVGTCTDSHCRDSPRRGWVELKHVMVCTDIYHQAKGYL